MKHAGVDCGQLVAAVFHEAGLIEKVDIEDYPSDWMLHRSEERFLGIVERYARKVDDRAAEHGDIVLFRYGRTLSHGAIVVGWPLIIHAHLRSRAVVLSSIMQETELQSRYAGIWTLKEWT